MTEKVKMQEKIVGIDYSEVYSKNEVAQLFSCLSPEAQDELLSVMREMVGLNKVARVSTQTAG